MTITSLADTVVTVPAAVAIVVWLVTGHAWRMAFWWMLLFTLGLLLVAATKIAFAGWGIGIHSLDFTGISGHAMRATAILPVIFFLMLRHASFLLRVAGIAFGILLGVLVGVSRLAVHAHSMSEAVSGCALGASVALGFIWISRSMPKPAMDRWIVAASLVALLPTTYAKPAPTDRWIDGVALYLSGRDQPYVRTAWKTASPLKRGSL